MFKLEVPLFCATLYITILYYTGNYVQLTGISVNIIGPVETAAYDSGGAARMQIVVREKPTAWISMSHLPRATEKQH